MRQRSEAFNLIGNLKTRIQLNLCHKEEFTLAPSTFKLVRSLWVVEVTKASSIFEINPLLTWRSAFKFGLCPFTPGLFLFLQFAGRLRISSFLFEIFFDFNRFGFQFRFIEFFFKNVSKLLFIACVLDSLKLLVFLMRLSLSYVIGELKSYNTSLL